LFTKTVSQLACLALIAFLFGAGVYRAATQSIVIDEAYTYNRFVAPPLAESLATYDANNHVLHTLLCKVSVACFGLSELSLRLPALLGSLLFLVSVWRLARYVLGRGWLCLLAVAVVGLNPFVLDYLWAARGYSLALGLFFWSLFLLTRYLSEDYDPPERLLFRAGVVLGLSVAANLVFVVPAVAAGAALLAARRARLWTLVDRFCGPALVTAFLILVLPLTRAQGANFYYGTNSIAETVRSLVILPAGLSVAVPVLVLVILVGAASHSRAPALLLLGGTMALSLAAVVAAHALLGVLYPLGRTGIYWPPLFALAAVFTLPWLRRAKLPGKLAAAAVSAVLLVSVGLFAASFRTGPIPEWRYDAGTRRIVRLLMARHATEPARRIQLGVSWPLEPSLNFYRQMYDLKWLVPVTRADPDGDYDFYVLLPQDQAILKTRALEPLYTDPVSQATLAQKRGQTHLFP
jgi:hypothetical protein